MANDYLYHYGVKGQKWYRRLYQNPDGSLTTLGRLRRRQGNGKDSHKEGNAGKTNSTTSHEEATEEKRSRLLKSTDAKELYKNRSLLSTAELNERINRIDTETRLKSRIAEDNKKTGLAYINEKMDKTRETVTKVANLYKSLDDAYSTFAKSAAGKAVMKKLGINVEKKEDFDINKLWKNRNKMSTKDLEDATKRIGAEKKIRAEIDRLKKEADAEAAKKENLAKAQKQVDDYIDSLYNDDRYYRMKGSEIKDGRTYLKTFLLEDKSAGSKKKKRWS